MSYYLNVQLIIACLLCRLDIRDAFFVNRNDIFNKKCIFSKLFKKRTDLLTIKKQQKPF